MNSLDITNIITKMNTFNLSNNQMIVMMNNYLWLNKMKIWKKTHKIFNSIVWMNWDLKNKILLRLMPQQWTTSIIKLRNLTHYSLISQIHNGKHYLWAWFHICKIQFTTWFCLGATGIWAKMLWVKKKNGIQNTTHTNWSELK